MACINHIVIEAFCNADIKKDVPVPAYCEQTGQPSYKCLFNKCPLFDFTSYENAIIYSGKDSDCGGGCIALGDDDDIELWERICKKKIDEAWEEYVKYHPEADEE